jgi:hypothetical protein
MSIYILCMHIGYRFWFNYFICNSAESVFNIYYNYHRYAEWGLFWVWEHYSTCITYVMITYILTTYVHDINTHHTYHNVILIFMTYIHKLIDMPNEDYSEYESTTLWGTDVDASICMKTFNTFIETFAVGKRLKTCSSIYSNTNKYINICKYVCTYASIDISINTHTYVYIYMYIYIHVHICIYICIHIDEYRCHYHHQHHNQDYHRHHHFYHH